MHGKAKLTDGLRRLLGARFVRFCLVGGMATLIHAGVFLMACEAGVPTFAANTLGYVISLGFNVTANFAWTFGEPLWQRLALGKVGRFILITLWGFALNSLISVGVVDVMGAAPVWAALLMVTVTPVTVYLLNLRLVFRRAAMNPPGASRPGTERLEGSSGSA